MTPTDQIHLAELLARCSNDPLAFVRGIFHWGLGELEGYDGPDVWQQDILSAIRDGLLTPNEAIRIAVASGHGIGKSALVAWLILWSIMTHEDAKGVVTANTETQLKTKTWAEVAKWHRRCLGCHLFQLTATALFSKDPIHAKTWRIDMVPWSERNTEAFAGLHNEGKRVMLFFDEASAIPDAIWEVAEGALTDRNTQIIWCCFGNPTQNSGRFKGCFGRFKHRWKTWQIDARSCRLTNKAQIRQWIDDYGEDSDFCRVRIRGIFPRAAANQFISSEAVAVCRDYRAEGYHTAPKIMGVDVARFGEDQTVFSRRQGRKVFPMLKFRGLDTSQVAAQLMACMRQWAPQAVFIDGVGVGGGVVDQCRALGYDVIEVNAGSTADDKVKYLNLRAEMWDRMRAAIQVGLELPEDPELAMDLTGVQYQFTAKQQIQLEKKESMKSRGLGSPDCADALALTYARPVLNQRELETDCYPEE